VVKIECRDALVYDADLAGFQGGLGQFKGTSFTSGKATQWQSKDGSCVVFQDPVVEVDETMSDPEDVKQYIQGRRIFRLRTKP
jgi:hypothetical protein